MLEPAIGLADGGFPVSDLLAQQLRSDAGPESVEGLDHFHAGSGGPLAPDGQLMQEDLARP